MAAVPHVHGPVIMVAVLSAVQLLLEHSQSCMTGGMAARLDPPVAADHRRRDRHDLQEPQLLPDADHGSAGHHQRRAVTLSRDPAGLRHQIRHPDREQRRGPRRPGRCRRGRRWKPGSVRSAGNVPDSES